MKKIKEIFKNISFFKGLDEEAIDSIIQNLDVKIKEYEKEEYIIFAFSPHELVGVVIEGNINVIKEDFWGNKTIIRRIAQGEIFAEAFMFAGKKSLPLSVVAKEKSKILFFNHENLFTNEHLNDSHKLIIAHNIIKESSNKNIYLTNKIEHMSKKTLKEKIMSYLSFMALNSKSDTFDIPFNRQELADYLSVDRSALSNELSKLRDEGVLTFKKNHFALIKEDEI